MPKRNPISRVFKRLAERIRSPCRPVADQQFLVAQDAAAMEADRGMIASDQAQLDYTTLRAPFDGVTGLLQIQIGNLIQPTNTMGIVVLAQVQPIAVVFILPNADIAAVQAGYGERTGCRRRLMIKPTTADVERLPVHQGQAADFRYGSAQGDIPESTSSALAWDVRQCSTTTSVVPNALTIPTNALQQNDKGQFVYVVGADKRVSVRPVEVAQRLRGIALISKGLQAGETVVVQGQYRLTPGTPVVAMAPSRCRTRRPPVLGCCREPLQRFHHQADCNHAFDGRGRGAGDRQLPPASRRCVAQIDLPTIQVTAQMPGADPQTMASSVATQLERQFGQIPGLSQMTSSSGTGFTEITLQLSDQRDRALAAIDVQAAINATQAQLPISSTSPIYRKTNPADTPILLVSMTSDVLPIMTVSDYAYSILAQKVSQVSGVGLVTVGGNLSPSIRIAQPGPARRHEFLFRNGQACAGEPDRRSANRAALRRSTSGRASDE